MPSPAGKNSARTAAIEIARRWAWFPAAVFGLHLIIARILYWYDAVPPMDIFMHLLGGVAIAYFFLGALETTARHGLTDPVRGLFRIVIVVALTASAAMLWEFAEFTSDHTIGTTAQLGLGDTLLDMLLGTIGGACYAGTRLR